MADDLGKISQQQTIFSGGGAAQFTQLLLDSLAGKKSSTTSQNNISAEGMNSLIQQILGGSQGLATVAGGQKAAGLYNSSTNQLLTNDLITRASGELAARQAGTTTTQKQSPQVSGSDIGKLLLILGGSKLLAPTVKGVAQKTGLATAGEDLANFLGVGEAAALPAASAGVGGLSGAATLGVGAGALTPEAVFGANTSNLGAAYAGGDALDAILGTSLTGSALDVAGSTIAGDTLFGGSLGALDLGGASFLSGAGEAAGVLGTAAEGAGLLETLTSIGGFLASFFSDERMKKDIKEVGETKEGQPIYTFKYKGDPIGKTNIGVMAQESLKFHPESVTKHPSGALMVNYDKLLGVGE